MGAEKKVRRGTEWRKRTKSIHAYGHVVCRVSCAPCRGATWHVVVVRWCISRRGGQHMAHAHGRCARATRMRAGGTMADNACRGAWGACVRVSSVSLHSSAAK